MFRLKFLNGRKRSWRRTTRLKIDCDEQEDVLPVNSIKTNRLNGGRTIPTDSAMAGPRIEYEERVPSPIYIPQRPANEQVASHKITTTQPVGHSSSYSVGYSKPIEAIREEEYPHMNKGIYLDHSGTTIYAKSTITSFSQRMLTTLYGNPHSANDPARLSGEAVDAVREQTLRFFGADPAHFDLVFVANATAGIKLVADAFRDLAQNTRSGTFWYGYHKEAHTSLVGVREYTGGDHHCFEFDADVEAWLSDPGDERVVKRRNVTGLGLLAYPGQSNLSGRRLPVRWTRYLRESQVLANTYSLFDAAALAMTSPLDQIFADPRAAPDFTVVSFYKIFGFPDLGGLIVRKDSGHILALRKYFGGGTVSMVSAFGGWHKSKTLDAGPNGAIHEGLEDGTLPFHSIVALGEAMEVHKKLFGGERCMENISAHVTGLVRVLFEGMKGLRHANGQEVVCVYSEDEGAGLGDARLQGGTVAFNVLRADGSYVPYDTVEGMANERGIYVRSGAICCPGGLFSALGYEQWELDRARSAGHECGPRGLSVIHQLPTGVVRASIGAMTTMREIESVLTFLRDVFVERDVCGHSTRSDDRDSAVAMHPGVHSGPIGPQLEAAPEEERVTMFA